MFKLVLKKLLKALLITLTVLTGVATAVGLSFSIYVDRFIEKDIDESLFYVVGSESQTRIFYYEYKDRVNREGEAIELLEEEIYGGYRSEFVSFEQIPQDMINAFVSIEDKRFYSHSGVDWFRTASAGVNYYLKFRDSYGGSTITQQLIKNVTDRDDYSFQRKLQEIFWALDLETKMDKREILELYLNIINLSQGCYGIGAAAEYYFSKDVSELTLSECACIAAITNSPTYYDPIKNPENNEKRRQLILSQMFGQGYISKEAYEGAKNEAVVLQVKESNRESSVNSWYVDMVIDDVMSDLMEQYGYSRAMASLVVYTGGLRIYTVMDRDIQQTLEKYYENESNFYFGSGENPQSSMIVIDSKTGDILGVAGAVGKKTANRLQNFATYSVRPAGSVIKPLSVYAPAMEAGIITWSTVYDDTPVNFGNYNLDKDKGKIVEPSPWPKNSGGVYRGLTNVDYAIVHSINTVAVKILEDVGLERSFDFLYDRLKIKSLISGKTLESGAFISDKDYAALALGQFNYGVTVREITAAYSIFSNGGIYNDYRSYIRVTDSNGDSVLEQNYHGEAVISRENADIMTEMLQNVVKEGTASEITLDEYVDCAGKTGTTQNKYDNWYIGYTPYYIGGVWMGYEYPKPLNDYSGNRSIRIWNDIMTELHSEHIESEGLLSFEKSEKVVEREYCMDSGKLMTAACRMDPRGDRSEVGYFAAGREPTEPCDRHIAVSYDKICGGVCVGECPEEDKTTVGLICVNRSFPMEIFVTDAQYTWRDIGMYILPETAPALPFYNNLAAENEFFGVSNVEIQYNRACREHFNYFEWKKKQEIEE